MRLSALKRICRASLCACDSSCCAIWKQDANTKSVATGSIMVANMQSCKRNRRVRINLPVIFLPANDIFAQTRWLGLHANKQTRIRINIRINLWLQTQIQSHAPAVASFCSEARIGIDAHRCCNFLSPRLATDAFADCTAILISECAEHSTWSQPDRYWGSCIDKDKRTQTNRRSDMKSTTSRQEMITHMDDRTRSFIPHCRC